MFLDRKNQYCENDYITQSNLQIQCNPYQITNGIFYRTRTKNLKICMEIQKTPNSQSSLEGQKRSWKNQHCDNDSTTQSSLQIPYNPYQTTNGIFHRTRTKNFTICIVTEKTLYSQSNLEKEKQSWRNQAP